MQGASSGRRELGRPSKPTSRRSWQQADEYREADRAPSSRRRRSWSYPRRRGAPTTTLKARIRKGTIGIVFCPVSAARRSRTRASSPCSTPSSTISRPPWTSRHRRHASTTRRRSCLRKPADRRAFSALAFKVMADPFVGSLTFFRVYSGKLASRRTRTTRSREEGAHRPHPADARQPARRRRRRCAGDIVADRGSRTRTTGDTLCDRVDQIILERMEFPEPVIKVADRAQDQGGSREDVAGLIKLARRTRPSTSPATTRPTRPSSRAWASSTSTSSSTASSASSRLRRRRRAPGELPRVHLQGGDRQVHAQEAVRRFRPVRRGADQVRALEPGVRLRVRDTTSRAAPFPRSTSPASHRASSSMMGAGVIAGFPVVDVKATLFDGNYHDVDSSVMAFEIAARGRSARASRSAARSCSSPSCRSTSSPPRTPWATSSATSTPAAGRLASSATSPAA